MRMNKKLILALLTTTALLAGCGAEGDRKAVDETAEIIYFEATVLETADQMLLVEPMEGTNERKSSDQIWVGMKSIPDEEITEIPSDIEVGDTVSIGYDGVIAETYPAQINEAFSVVPIN